MVKEKEAYREELAEEQADKIEEAKIQEDEDWADQMEAMEMAEMQAQAEEPEEKPEPYDPRTDPKNIEWMEKHMEENKLFFGDDYGEDISLNFDDSEDK